MDFIILKKLNEVIFLTFLLVSCFVVSDGKYYNSHAKPLQSSLEANQRNTNANYTNMNKFRYIQHKPSIRRNPLPMAAHSPEYYHFHYMQNLRRQHEKPEKEDSLSALRGPTKFQILGKPANDVEVSIFEDLKRQTKNFTLDEIIPVTERKILDVDQNISSEIHKYQNDKQNKKNKGNKKETTSVKQKYKETFEETRPIHKSGSRRTIKTQKTVSFSTTIKPLLRKKLLKGKSHHKNLKLLDSDRDNVEGSDTRKVLMTTIKRSKSINPHLFEAPDDNYYPIHVDQDKENYSMEWDDKYNIQDFQVRRSDTTYTPKLRKPKANQGKKRNSKQITAETSEEIPILDIYGGGKFDTSEEEPECEYESNTNCNNNKSPDMLSEKNYQDIYIKHTHPYVVEFGHLEENPYGWEERFQNLDIKNNRHKGKVFWHNKQGDFGEHHWDLHP